MNTSRMLETANPPDTMPSTSNETVIFGKMIAGHDRPVYPGHLGSVRIRTMTVMDMSSGEKIENLPWPQDTWSGDTVKISITTLPPDFNPHTLH